jgi:hypothetical protein
MDITNRFLEFREAVRHLWNVNFSDDATRGQDWDLRDAFSVAYVALFRAMVMYRLPKSALPIAHLWDADTTVLDCYHVSSRSSELQLMIARDCPASGYWDHPITRVATSTVDLRLISLFDWDTLGFRDFRYLRVRISRADNTDLIGRDALIDFADCYIVFRPNEETQQAAP